MIASEYDFDYDPAWLKQYKRKKNILPIIFSVIGLAVCCFGEYKVSTFYVAVNESNWRALLWILIFILGLIIIALTLIISYSWLQNVSVTALHPDFHFHVEIRNRTVSVSAKKGNDVIFDEFVLKHRRETKNCVLLYKNSHYYICIPKRGKEL